jgi:uncharacterized membrane protein
MSKTSGKKRKQIKKTSPSRRATSNLYLPPNATKFQGDKAIFVSHDILIKSGAVSCFNLIASRLEGSVQWDPIIVRAEPISESMCRHGAASQLTMNLIGTKLESPAVVTVYKPDRTLAWVLVEQPKVKEYWRLEPDMDGTVVHVTLGYEIPGRGVDRLLKKLFWKGKLEQELGRLLDQLKRAAEATDLQK